METQKSKGADPTTSGHFVMNHFGMAPHPGYWKNRYTVNTVPWIPSYLAPKHIPLYPDIKTYALLHSGKNALALKQVR